MKRESIVPYVSMLLGSVAFAAMGAMVHALGSSCDWQVILVARSLLPLTLVAGLAWAAGAPLVFWGPRILWVRSIAGSLSMISTFYALTHLPISDVFTLTNMFPVWVAVLSWPLLREAPSRRVWLAVGCVVLGVVLMEQPRFVQGNPATLAALAASLFTAVAMLGLNRLQDIDPRAIVVHFSGVALVFAAASLCLLPRAAPLANVVAGPNLLLLLGLGVAATVGQLFLTRAFTLGEPAKVSVVGLTQIVFALGFDVFLWQHSFEPTTLLGMALVVGPTAWLMTQPTA